MRNKADIEKILDILNREYPDARCSLDHANPLELIVATILSAQCTDERVNKVTSGLFRKYKTAGDYSAVPLTQLEEDIRSTGFFRNKAKSLKGLGEALVEKHGGRVPETLDELVRLPGVGRKTANVVLGVAFGLPGMVVDTHVGRIAGRLGLTENTDPVKIEYDLMEQLPRDRWTVFGHQVIAHGRAVCTARNPRCPVCAMLQLCPFGQSRN